MQLAASLRQHDISVKCVLGQDNVSHTRMAVPPFFNFLSFAPLIIKSNNLVCTIAQ